jgi:hypothetical protein
VLPESFRSFEDEARKMGFAHAAVGVLARSSGRAELKHSLVMPAKAGIHACRDAARCSWIPARAGMTRSFQSLRRVGIRQRAR